MIYSKLSIGKEKKEAEFSASVMESGNDLISQSPAR